ncbi:MAG: calcium-binding protein [Methylococcaceae bacterium]|nr:calcium-binding protein [Methylococcaceae bacterium]
MSNPDQLKWDKIFSMSIMKPKEIDIDNDGVTDIIFQIASRFGSPVPAYGFRLLNTSLTYRLDYYGKETQLTQWSDNFNQEVIESVKYYGYKGDKLDDGSSGFSPVIDTHLLRLNDLNGNLYNIVLDIEDIGYGFGRLFMNQINILSYVNGTGDHNTLIGTEKNELISGFGGNDSIAGGLGNDVLVGGVGDDNLDGGFGIDRAEYNTATSGVTVNLTITTPQNTIGAGIDSIINIENVSGSRFDDTLTGNATANVISGHEGNDTLTGGEGVDKFLFNTTLDSLNNVDTVTDFNHSDDRIRLDNKIFTQFTNGRLAADSFVIGNGATALDSNDFLIYDTSDGTLYYDADANGSGQQIEFVSLTGIPALTSLDFIII